MKVLENQRHRDNSVREHLLETLKALYSHLEPIGLELPGSQLPLADTAEATEV